MKTLKFTMFLVYIGFTVYGSLPGQSVYLRDKQEFTSGSASIELGGISGWQKAEIKNSITEMSGIRPYSVLALSSAAAFSTVNYIAAKSVWGNLSPLEEPALDLLISFDENLISDFKDTAGRYRVISAGVENADRFFARAGPGAALFKNEGQIRVMPKTGNALFRQGNRISDFTIEFWLYPLNMENGEEILAWTSTIGKDNLQKINCYVSKNRLTWSFVNFFASIDGNSFLNFELSGRTAVNPKKWSHHLIRFDASTGLLEYVINGESEAIEYTTSSGRENIHANGVIYTPVTGNDGFFTLGGRFTGIMDEVKIHEIFAGRSSIQKYPSSGGRIETGAIDLGHNNSSILKVEASGGRISIKGKTIDNEFRESASGGRFRFSCDAQMSFYIRAADNPYMLGSYLWRLFSPGESLQDVRGRYVQIAADFYPSADGEISPYLDMLQIVYLPGEPPLPPRNVTAVAADGGVMLSWKSSPNENTAGYLIYYDTVRGELFGNDALQGASPINAGKRNSLFIEGLKNGTLYYFRIAAYDEYSTGEFSSEVTARPIARIQ